MSMYSSNTFQVYIEFGFQLLNCCYRNDCDWLTLHMFGQVKLWAGPWYHCSATWLIQCDWLQVTSSLKAGSTCILDGLLSFLWIGRSRDVLYVFLYVNGLFVAFGQTTFQQRFWGDLLWYCFSNDIRYPAIVWWYWKVKISCLLYRYTPTESWTEL